MLRLSIAYLLAVSISSQVHADEIIIDTSITDVTIYRDVAGVVREGQIDIPSGNHTLIFSGLTSDLDQDSLALGIPSRNLLIGALEIVRVEEQDVTAEKERELRGRIQALNDQSRAIDDEMAAARIQLSFLESLAQGYAKEAWKDSVSGSADPAQWQQAVTFLGTGAATARSNMREGEIRKRGIAREIDAIRRELQQIATGRKSSYEIRVAASTPAPVSVNLRLAYRVEDTYWQPRYEFRLDTEARTMDIILSANVSQNTGEDWDNVALALSTSRPSDTIAAPEINPVFVGIREPIARLISRAPATFEQEAVDQIVVSGSRTKRAELDTTGFTAIYRVGGRISLATGAAEQSYVLSEEQEEVTLKVRAVPKFDPVGYLYATFDYNGQAALRAGSASIFRDGDFVGTNELDLIRPGEEAEFAVGHDELIEISYDYDGGEKSDSGIFNRTKREDRKYLIKVTNRHASAVDVEIVDQWPVPQDEDIEVKALASATPPTESGIEGEPGILYWRDNLAPGETLTIRHHYRISYPADKTLTPY